MDRRQFILALSAAASLLGIAPARAECGGPSAIEFVEGLYEKQVHVVLDEADGWLIANIIYDNGKSLIDHYRDIAGR